MFCNKIDEFLSQIELKSLGVGLVSYETHCKTQNRCIMQKYLIGFNYIHYSVASENSCHFG